MSDPRSPDRRTFVTLGTAALAGAAIGRRVESAGESFDVVIRGGTVVDGTGAPAFPADVGLKGDTIAAVGRLEGATAARTIDATGLHVTPGFIDIHSHSDGNVLAYPTADSRVRQGVTTELAG